MHRSSLEEQDIKKDHRNLVSENSDTESYIRNDLSKHTPKVELFKNLLSSSLRKVRFSDQKFTIGTPVSNIKYNYLRFISNQ